MNKLDKTFLQEKKQQLADAFGRVQGEIRQIELQESGLGQRKSQLNIELFRLQGESRLIDEILSEDKEAETPAPAEDVTKV